MHACLNGGETLDRPPVALWRHFPVDDQSAETLAAAHLQFQTKLRLGFPESHPGFRIFCVRLGRGGSLERASARHSGLHQTGDPRAGGLDCSWNRYSPHKGHLAVQMHRPDPDDGSNWQRHSGDLHGLQPALASPRNWSGTRNCSVHLRQIPGRDQPRAGERSPRLDKDFITAVINQAGADGIFFAVQHAQPTCSIRRSIYQFGRPYDLPVLQAAADGWLNVLHLHGDEVYFDQFTDYPIQVINWHDLETQPDLKTGLEKFRRVVCGGIRQEATLNLGTAEEVRGEAAAAIAGHRRETLHPGDRVCGTDHHPAR